MSNVMVQQQVPMGHSEPVYRRFLGQVRLSYQEVSDVELSFAEPLPQGFGFSETAFRIFVLMASRRLKSDRFFTDDYRPEIYTQLGLDFIKETTMLAVLKRHHPTLSPALQGVENAFHPWKAVRS